jgi:hypothetical protein
MAQNRLIMHGRDTSRVNYVMKIPKWVETSVTCVHPLRGGDAETPTLGASLCLLRARKYIQNEKERHLFLRISSREKGIYGEIFCVRRHIKEAVKEADVSPPSANQTFNKMLCRRRTHETGSVFFSARWFGIFAIFTFKCLLWLLQFHTHRGWSIDTK